MGTRILILKVILFHAVNSEIMMFFVGLVFVFSFSSCEIVQVQIVSRHCDRTPLTPPLPNCPVDIGKKLNLGPGFLTPLGEFQCYSLGKKIKNTYLDPKSDLYLSGIAPLWNNFDYNFYSTQVTRALRSSWSISKALFPIGHKVDITPLEANFSLPDGAQSIPITTSYELRNDIVLAELGICIIRGKLCQDWLDSEAGEEWLKEREVKYMMKINSVAGTNYSFEEIGIVEDIVKILADHQLLCKDIQEIQELIEDGLTELMTLQLSPKFSGGVPIGQGIVNAMNDNINNLFEKKNTAKYVHYSAHDTSLFSLFLGLELLQDYPELNQHPDFGSAAFLELHKNSSIDEYFVQLKYQNLWSANPRVLVMKSFGCDQEMCDLKLFQSLVKKKLTISIEDWCSKCQNTFTETCLENSVRYRNAFSSG